MYVQALEHPSFISLESLIAFVHAPRTLHWGDKRGPSRQVPLLKELMLNYFRESILNQFSYLYSLLELIISEIHSSFTLPLPKSIVFTLETLFLYVIEAASVLLLKIYYDSTLTCFFLCFFQNSNQRQIKLVLMHSTE